MTAVLQLSTKHYCIIVGTSMLDSQSNVFEEVQKYGTTRHPPPSATVRSCGRQCTNWESVQILLAAFPCRLFRPMFQTCQGVLAPCAPNTSSAVEIVAWAARAASLRCTSPGSIGKNTAAARRPAIRTAARACALGARCTPAHVALFAIW